MTKKRIFIAALMLAAAIPVFSQTDTKTTPTETVESINDKYEAGTNRFRDNCFVSIGAGAQMYFGDHNRQLKFGDRISPAFDIAVGKWFPSGIGVRLMYSGLPVKGATQNGAHSNGEAISGKPWHGYWLTEQKFNLSNLHADVMFDMIRLLSEKESPWSVSPYVGVGWVHVGDSPKADGVSGNFGVFTSYSLSRMFDLNLDLRGVLLKDGMDGEKGGCKGESMLTATIGIGYKF